MLIALLACVGLTLGLLSGFATQVRSGQDGVALDRDRRSLVVSRATVKTNVNRIFFKTGSRDRGQAVRYAYRLGTGVRVGRRERMFGILGGQCLGSQPTRI